MINMKIVRLSGVWLVMAATAVNTSASAQSHAQPRPPLSPGAVDRLWPKELGRMPAHGEKSISVTNIGNVTLKFSAWDGALSWNSYDLTPGQTVTVSCERCADAISIAFNDGTKTRTVSAKTAERYAMYWMKSEQRWDFASFADITQRVLAPVDKSRN